MGVTAEAGEIAFLGCDHEPCTSSPPVNYLGLEGDQRVRDAFGVNYDRLVQVKQRYDPVNFFRLNQNIAPE